ncbi:MAG: BatA domain-containing protein [Pirellulaceae bacterium]
MSFLTWIFALGAAGIIFPLLFHLIRPTPRGSLTFSSLMFLRQSPPRISRRSRLDNWLLLLLRCLIILLIVAAFMRPYFRTGGAIFTSDLPGKRMAILIDTSASMQRDGLWRQVQDRLNETLNDLEPGDEVALFSFDRTTRAEVGFPEERTIDLASRIRLIRNQFATLEPGYAATDLGGALVTCADIVTELDDRSRSEIGLQIVLISDMQAGGQLGALQTYGWPEDVRVDVRPVRAAAATNATARVLPDEATRMLDDSGRRVRVTNAADSGREQFRVAWSDDGGGVDEETRTSFYVPPGSSQVLRVPPSESLSASRLILTGDDAKFDNEFFVVPKQARQIPIAWFGNDKADDPRSALYFLKRLLPESRNLVVTLDEYSVSEPGNWNNDLIPQLVIVTDGVSSAVAEQLRSYVATGGLLLAVVTDPEVLASLQNLLGPVAGVDASREDDDYLMLSGIDFSHPLFSPLSGPRFNDFTKVRFWNHLPLSVDEDNSTSIIARFDNNEPAIWQHTIEEGQVLGFASSWRPADSQLARSSKFVPLITNILGMGTTRLESMDACIVGQSIELPETNRPWQVQRPDGRDAQVAGMETGPDLFDRPGIYNFRSGNTEFDVVVNLEAAESQTAAIPGENLEAFDVLVGTQPTREEIAGNMQKMKDAQLESRQRIWKWLLVAALGLLILETLLAGRRFETSFVSEATTA